MMSPGLPGKDVRPLKAQVEWQRWHREVDTGQTGTFGTEVTEKAKSTRRQSIITHKLAEVGPPVVL